MLPASAVPLQKSKGVGNTGNIGEGIRRESIPGIGGTNHGESRGFVVNRRGGETSGTLIGGGLSFEGLNSRSGREVGDTGRGSGVSGVLSGKTGGIDFGGQNIFRGGSINERVGVNSFDGANSRSSGGFSASIVSRRDSGESTGSEITGGSSVSIVNRRSSVEITGSEIAGGNGVGGNSFGGSGSSGSGFSGGIKLKGIGDLNERAGGKDIGIGNIRREGRNEERSSGFGGRQLNSDLDETFNDGTDEDLFLPGKGPLPIFVRSTGTVFKLPSLENF
jgi:hypothetical protein